jgi:hypothetical protein
MSAKCITIHMWCAPRSLSTATTYSFSRRPDTIVFDEPLYACYLYNNPTIFRPYREELIASSNVNGNEIMDMLNSASANVNKPIKFAKHIAKFIPHVNRKYLFGENIHHVFLIRDPIKQLHSWNAKQSVHNEEFSLETSGLLYLMQLYSEIRRESKANHQYSSPIIVDSDMLANNPEVILNEMCVKLNIPFYSEQLTWPAGPKPDVDGYVFKLLFYYYI